MTSIPTVMISSTFLDLPGHREKALEACQRLGFPTRAMEHTTAADRTTFQQSMKMVSESDIYVLLLGFRYGTIPHDQNESLTVLEYRRAQQLGLPSLVFCMAEDHPITRADVEVGPGAEKLAQFKNEVRTTGRVRAEFSSKENLMSLILQALVEERDRIPLRKKSHRITSPEPPEPWAVHPYSLMQTNALIGRQVELAELDQWLQGSDSSIMVVHAIGGMGKSALTWDWFRSLSIRSNPQFRGAFWWSFYETDAGFNNFVLNALLYTTCRPQSDFEKMGFAQRTESLRRALDQEPFILVLDGFERELNAYARLDAARLNDEADDKVTQDKSSQSVDWSRRGRHALDTRVGQFLRSLIGLTRSKVLISSRIFPADLEGDTHGPLPGVMSKELTGLNIAEAAELWRSLGVRGSSQALSRLFESIQGYPLLVRAMAGQVSNFRRAPGDFDAWRRAHPRFDPYKLELKQRRTFVLDFALRGIDKTTWQVLSTVAAFRMPAPYSLLVAVLVGSSKTCRDEEALIVALEELEGRGIVGWNRVRNSYDLHPIVRSVVWTKVTMSDRRQIYSVIESEFESMPSVDSQHVTTASELFIPIELMRLFVEREMFDAAFTIYKTRLEDPLRRLGLYDKRKELLAPMFQGLDPDGPSGISSRLRSDLSKRDASIQLAYAIDSCGDTTSALKLMQYHNKFCDSEICKLHQHRIFNAAGQRRTAEMIVQSLLQEIRKGSEAYMTDHEFYCLYYLGIDLDARNELLLPHVALSRMRTLSTRSGLLMDEVRAQGFILDLEYEILRSTNEDIVAVDTASKQIFLARSCKNDVELLAAFHNRFYAVLACARIEEGMDDLRSIMELANMIGGQTNAYGAEKAQAYFLFKQARLDEAETLLKSLQSRFGDTLSLWNQVGLQREIGRVASAQQNFGESVLAATSILKLTCSTGDCPRGYEAIEWSINELRVHGSYNEGLYEWPRALEWDARLIDPTQ